MDFIINLTNAMTLPMVAFTIVFMGMIPATVVLLYQLKASRKKVDFNHQETMVSIETKHRENIAKIKSDDPKMIEARASSRNED